MDGLVLVGWFGWSIKEDVVFFPPSIPSPFLLRRSQLELKSTRRERDMGLFNLLRAYHDAH